MRIRFTSISLPHSAALVQGLCAAFALLVSLCVSGCRAHSHASAALPPSAPVARAVRASLSNTLQVAGEFLPYQEVDLHAKVSGYVRRIHVDIGDHVRAGQLLAELEIPELTAQVAGAEAGVERSKEEIERARSAVARAQADHDALHASAMRLDEASLASPGLIAQQELDDAHAKDSASGAQVDAAKSELAAMRQSMSAAKAEHQQYSSMANYARIAAPFSGVVTWRYADTGALLHGKHDAAVKEERA